MNALAMHTVDTPASDSKQQGLPQGAVPDDVVAAACRVAGISAGRLLGRAPGKGRTPKALAQQKSMVRSLVRFRAACAWILRERFRPRMSLPEIASHLGYYDHTTILHHLRTTCTRAETIDTVHAIEAEVRRGAAAKNAEPA